MPVNQKSSEEDYPEKSHSLRLIKRFLKFFYPYQKKIYFVILLVLLLTIFELILPYLTKIGIDNYIFPSTRRIEIKNKISFKERFKSDYAPFLISVRENILYIPSDKIKQIRQQDLLALQKEEALSEKIYYFTKKTYLNSKIANRYPELFISGDSHIFIAYNDLPKIKKQDLVLLRLKDLQGILFVFLLFSLTLSLSFLFNFGQIYLVELTGQKIMHDLRLRIFSHLQNLSLSFYDKNPAGRLVTRVTNDVENIHEMFNSIMINIFRDFSLILGIIAVLFSINWRLTFFCLSFLPLIGIITIFFSFQAREAFREVRLKIAKINTILHENITGIKIVKLFLREKENFRRFCEINHENYLANMKQILVFALFVPLIEIMGTATIALVIWYGGGNVIQGKISLGALAAFLAYLRMFFQPIRDISEKYNILQSAMASLERIFLLLDTQEFLPSTKTKIKKLHELKGHIEFQQVYFAYKNEEWVLKDVSFTIREGERVAIVGTTGAGKTTIINLILRFYEIQKGKILLDGIDIRELDTSFLRSQIGLVMQDVFLFACSLRKNILLGNEKISQDELIKIAHYVNAHYFIEKLPNKYDEIISEGGSNLSNGERQLLSFARALAVNPKILILDEATSNIDAETENLIQDALTKLIKNRTSLVIAHRLSTIQNCDRIIVLHHGKIKEQGTHSKLLSMHGIYSKLYKLQYQPSL